jgi:hypothetical protein
MREFLNEYITNIRKSKTKGKKLIGFQEISELNIVPLQIELFEIQYEEFSEFFFLFSSCSKLNDLEIIHKTVKVDPNELTTLSQEITQFIEQVQLFTSEQQSRDKKLQLKLRKTIIPKIHEEEKRPNDFTYCEKINLDNILPNCFLWFYRGKKPILEDIPNYIQSQVQNYTFNKLIFEPETFKNLMKNSVKTIENTGPKSSYWAYIKPPIWIGTFPKYSVEDELNKVPLSRKSQALIDEDLQTQDKTIHIKIASNGLFVINNSTREEALEFMNLLIGCLALRGYDIFQIFDREISAMMQNKSFKEFTSNSFRGEDRSIEGRKRNMYYPSWTLEQNFLSIKESDFHHAYQMINKYIFKSTKIWIEFYIAAYTNFRLSQYNQAFLNGWMILESFIHAKWNSILKKKQMSKNSRIVLEKYTIYQILKELKKTGKLTEEKYDSYDILRVCRNKLIHELKSVNFELAERCLNECIQVIYKRMPEFKKFPKHKH